MILGRQFSYTAYLSAPGVRTLQDAMGLALQRERLCAAHTTRQPNPNFSRGFSREHVYNARHRYRMSRRIYPDALRVLYPNGAPFGAEK